MTLEFVNKHCLNCDYCIYQDDVAWGCGEIDDGGCCSECLETLKSCRLGHKPIPHTPKFNQETGLNHILIPYAFMQL